MKAFQVLGLPDTATPDEVKARWRELCMTHHPDRGGNPVTFDEVRRAYKAAFAEASLPKPCQACGGSGKTAKASGFSTIQLACQACGGSGHA